MQESKPLPDGHKGPWFSAYVDLSKEVDEEDGQKGFSSGDRYVKTNPKNDGAKLQRMVKRAAERDLNHKFSQERKTFDLERQTFESTLAAKIAELKLEQKNAVEKMRKDTLDEAAKTQEMAVNSSLDLQQLAQ